jgi:hypothetical protein
MESGAFGWYPHMEQFGPLYLGIHPFSRRVPSSRFVLSDPPGNVNGCFWMLGEWG